MSILMITIFVSVVLAIYLLRVAVLNKQERKACLIKAVAVSVSAGTLAMLTYFVARGLEYRLGLMIFQIVLFSAMVFAVAALINFPLYERRVYLEELPDRMLENLKEAGK